MKRIKNTDGFTLIELIVVVGIIGILVGVASPRFTGFTKDAKVAAMKADVEVLETAAMLHHIDEESWPVDVSKGEPVPSEDLKIILDGAKIEYLDKPSTDKYVQKLSGNLDEYAIITSKGDSEGYVVHLKGVNDKKKVTHYSPTIKTEDDSVVEPGIPGAPDEPEVDPEPEAPMPDPEPETPEPEPEPETGGSVGSDVTKEGVTFLGEVPASELFTGEEISSATGVTEGTIHHNDESWLKFDDNGTILFVAKKTYRYNISWNHLNSKGVVNGTKTVSKDGQNFEVRLLTGIYSQGSISEWDRLMYPIHVNSEKLDKDMGILTHSFGTGGGRYIDSDLHVQGGAIGGTSWSQDVVFGKSSYGRGGHLGKPGIGVQMGDVKAGSFIGEGYGWRPVLELVK